jgi:NADH:ubiquinone oxidoreductase subunit 6 (subunit J)
MENLLLFFQFGLFVCAVGVIFSKNPVHSVLFLVLVFFECLWSYFVIGCGVYSNSDNNYLMLAPLLYCFCLSV